MKSNQLDSDVMIIAEEIPPVRSHALLSLNKVKIESIVNETVDLTKTPSSIAESNESPLILHESFNQTYTARPQVINRPRALLATPHQGSISANSAIPPRTIIAVNGGQIGNSGLSINGASPAPVSSTLPLRSVSSAAEIIKDLSSGDVSPPNLAELLAVVHTRKASSSTIPELRNIPSVNVHEFLKSTPAECFSRKGFYSCAGCSSKFTSSEMYNFHLRRAIGEFSYDCAHCTKTITTTNLCQVSMHLLSSHKGAVFEPDRASHKPALSAEAADAPGGSDDFLEPAKVNMKRVVEGFLNDWNVDLFSPYQRRTKDQRYFLLPLARKEVVQSHKFYSDHYRAATHKLKEHPVELLHCFMCDFVCENHNDLIVHLQGDWPNTVTKCAFCTLSVPINKESLCAAKAHVLLHMGVFIMCPRCGFVPPPDLSPDDFEITLRLHLRYVCFHFNLIQIFVCPHCGDSNSKAFNTANQVIMHIYDEHLVEQRQCPLCRVSADPAASSSAAFSNTELLAHLSTVHGRSDSESLAKDGHAVGRRCSECADLITQKESFFSHMTVHHKAQIVKGKSAFRCFGTCKRIHQSIDEFQSHRSECAECINVKNKLYQPQLQASNPESTSLCFCLYCGVGVRRKRLESGEIEVQSEPHMFSSLRETRAHEQDHILCETNITACPWCPSRMSARVTEMTQHMQTHLPDNWFLSWYTRRNERYHSHASDVMYCYCYAAIDNPLSLHCHAIPQVVSTSSSNPQANKHVALTDSIHREFMTSSRHTASGSCPLCADADVITNTMEMTWHIFFKHRNILCYVCKNYRLLNGDNSPRSRITMWKHVHQCLRQHTPRFNMKDGLELLRGIATCGTAMLNCTEFDLKRVSEISVLGDSQQGQLPSENAPSSGGTERANSLHSDSSRYECGYCRATSSLSKQFTSRQQLNEHLRQSHGLSAGDSIVEHLCLVCGVKFDSADKWEDHSLTEHTRGFRRIGLSVMDPSAVVLDLSCTTYRCYLCNHRFDRRASTQAHMLKRHSVDHNDLNWGMLTDTSTESSAKRAKLSINSSKTCLSTYPSRRLHASEAGPDAGPFVCGVCPLQVASRHEMVAHALSLHCQAPSRALDAPRHYLCPDCALAFVSARSRAVHLKLVHGVKGDPALFLASLGLS